jgi:5-methylcytosine-specific restriction endonuclease McrA
MSSILLLNATHQPLSFISHRRALALLQRGRVDPVSEEAVSLHGCSTVFHVPKVLRLRCYVQIPQLKVSWTRKRVLERDHYRCIYCGLRIGQRQDSRVLSRSDFTIDHILPKSRGGANTWVNTACACAACNQRKADRMPHEAGMKMLWEPKTPRTNYLVMDGDFPKSWKIYLEIGVQPAGAGSPQL